MKLRKISVFMIIIMLCPLLSGCWNSRELNTLGIVGIMGLDVEGDKVKVTLEVIKPNKGGIEPIPTLYLEKLLLLQGANSKTQAVNILDFIKVYYSQGKQPVSGVINKENIDTKEQNIKKEIVNAEGLAGFKNGKLVGFLTGSETKGFNFITNKAKSGIISFKKHSNKDITSVEILKAKSENSIELNGNEVNINIKVKISGMLGEETEELDVKDPKDIKEIEEIEDRASEIAKQDIEKAMIKAKEELKSDIFGFGSIVHKKYPKEWKNMKDNWDDIFANASFKVEVSTKILRSGLIDVPTNIERGKIGLWIIVKSYQCYKVYY